MAHGLSCSTAHGIFLDQGSNCRWILYYELPGKPRNSVFYIQESYILFRNSVFLYSEEKLKSLLMRVKEKSGKAGL